jgi:hypothetical protein
MIETVYALFILNVKNLHIGFCGGAFFSFFVYIQHCHPSISSVENINSVKYMPALNFYEE